MSKKRHAAPVAVPAELKAQRYPESPWLYVCNYGRWQAHKKPFPVWLAIDTGLLTEPGKRAVWEALGDKGLEVWLKVLVQASRESPCGLFERDPLWLQRRLGLSADGLGVLIDAGWMLCLTDEQAEVVRAGGDLADMVAAASESEAEAGEGRDETDESELRGMLFDAIAAGLTDIWGQPRTSGRTETLYWRPSGKKGPQVSLSLQKRRRAADTVVEVIVGDDRSDVPVPLDGRVSPAAVVERIVAAVGGANLAKSGNDDVSTTPPGATKNAVRQRNVKPHENVDVSTTPPGAAKNGDATKPRSDRCAQGSPPNRRSEPVRGDSKKGKQNTGQDSDSDRDSDRDRDRDRTVDSDKGQDRDNTGGAPRAASAAKESLRVCRDGTGAFERTETAQDPQTPQRPSQTRRNPPKPEAGRSNGSARKRSARASHASSARRSGAQPIGHLCKPYWNDADSVALGWEVFREVFPKRVDDESDDAKSEVGMFAKLWFEEVKAVVPSTWWPVLREKALAVARKVAKGKNNRRPGGVWASQFRKRIRSLAARASPSGEP